MIVNPVWNEAGYPLLASTTPTAARSQQNSTSDCDSSPFTHFMQISNKSLFNNGNITCNNASRQTQSQHLRTKHTSCKYQTSRSSTTAISPATTHPGKHNHSTYEHTSCKYQTSRSSTTAISPTTTHPGKHNHSTYECNKANNNQHDYLLILQILTIN